MERSVCVCEVGCLHGFGLMGSAHGNGLGRGWQVVVEVAVSGRPRRSVRQVSARCPTVAKVAVAGGGGSEGGES